MLFKLRCKGGDYVEKGQAPMYMSQFLTSYKKLISKKLEAYGFTDSEPCYGNIIHALSKHGKLTMKALASSIGRDKSTVTVLIRKLELRGVVRKISNPDDLRSKFIELTEKGIIKSQKFEEISEDINQQIWDNISDHEGEVLLEVLMKLINNIDKGALK